MDITSFVQSNREKAFLVGDYSAYRTQCSRQILSLRRKLKRTTPKNQKQYEKPPVTSEDIGSSHDYVHLQLLFSERAWAHAMSMKSLREDDTASGGITGSARKHIISRLHKAASAADHLVTLLTDRSTSKATDSDFLEAKGYALSMQGSEAFEKVFNKRYDDAQSQKAAWNDCLVLFSQAHIIYTALSQQSRQDLFKEALGGTIDPSIRYAAYQSRFPRTVSVSALAKQHFPREKEAALLRLVTKLQPDALDEAQSKKAVSKEGATTEVPTTISWRGRTAPIADAAVGQAIATTSLAIQQLRSQFADGDKKKRKAASVAAAYDPVLTAAQETVDAIRHAITELTKEGVPESDSRMQDLRVSDLAANYTLISWRIGRNRVLTSNASSADDGLTFYATTSRANQPKPRRASKAPVDGSKMDVDGQDQPRVHHESRSHQLSRLRARTALYDATLQSLTSITSLPGAARDTAFVGELDSKKGYFGALRALNIGYAHAVLGSQREALALFARAAEHASAAQPSTSNDSSTTTVPSLDIQPAHIEALQSHIRALLTRQRGLVALQQYAELGAGAAAEADATKPLALRLSEYPASGKVDLTRLVDYPPQLEPVPVKPIFLDLAWNFVDYPGRKPAVPAVAKKVVEEVDEMEVDGAVDTKAGQQQKKKSGWFGFGR